MEKKILKELQNIAKELKVIAKNTKKEKYIECSGQKTTIDGSHLLLCDDAPINTICQGKDGYEYFISEKTNGKITEATRVNRMKAQEEPLKPLLDTEQLAKLDNAIEEDLVYDQEDAVKFIFNKLRENERNASIDLLYEILDYEEDYMRSVGIIED